MVLILLCLIVRVAGTEQCAVFCLQSFHLEPRNMRHTLKSCRLLDESLSVHQNSSCMLFNTHSCGHFNLTTPGSDDNLQETWLSNKTGLLHISIELQGCLVICHFVKWTLKYQCLLFSNRNVTITQFPWEPAQD